MLAKSVLIYVLGEVFSKALPFLLLPYLTRELGVEGFGELSLYQAWCALAVIFVSYIQEAAIIRYIYFYGKKSVGLVLVAGRLYTITVFVLSVIVSIILNNEFLFYVTLCCFSQSLIKIELTIRQAFKEPHKYVFLLLISSLLSVLFTILFFEFIESSPIGRILSITFGNLFCVLIAYTLYSNKLFKLSWNLKKIKLGILYIFTFSSPLLINSIATFFKGQFDRLLIADKFSVEDLGVYAAGFQIASIVLLLLLSVSRAVEPFYYENLKSKNWTLNKIFSISLKFSPLLFLPFIFSLFIPAEIYTLILGKGFIGIEVFVSQFVFAFSVIGIYMVFSIYLNYHGKTKELTSCNIISVVLYIFLLFSLSEAGINYIAYATIIANIVLVILTIFLSVRISKSVE